MSRGGYLSAAMRTGARMGDTKLVDMMVATLTDPFGVGHMGITAENLCTKWGITRDQQDALAVESHRRAAAAIAEGRFHLAQRLHRGAGLHVLVGVEHDHAFARLLDDRHDLRFEAPLGNRRRRRRSRNPRAGCSAPR